MASFCQLGLLCNCDFCFYLLCRTIGAKIGEAFLLVVTIERDGKHSQAAAALHVLRPIHLSII
jgi:hypothetical protein